jgi:hypothetical protein
VGDERSVINHGEAVEWPPGVAHGAWTDGTPMRAILIEVADMAIDGGPGAGAGGAAARPVGTGAAGDTATAARGRLAPRPPRPEDHDPSEGEPW